MAIVRYKAMELLPLWNREEAGKIQISFVRRCAGAGW